MDRLTPASQTKDLETSVYAKIEPCVMLCAYRQLINSKRVNIVLKCKFIFDLYFVARLGFRPEAATIRSSTFFPSAYNPASQRDFIE